ncbi:MAG: RNA polymerase sigma factor [Acidimicrobiia bacterium]|nr:RNA polymerase sigma factor [Acidimicrobiia bacterium]
MASGDRGALDELYRRHATWITIRLARRCGDPDVVDSAVQDTFVDAWRSAAKWKPTGEPAAWLWVIARRRLVDLLRKRPPPEPMADVAAVREVLSHEVPLALGHTDLGQAFLALTPELQAVLALTALDGYSTREAATILCIPHGTVKTRLQRARQQLGGRTR